MHKRFPMIVVAYSLDYDGTWFCVYVGDSRLDAGVAIRKSGPWDGNATLWTTMGEPMTMADIQLSRLVVE
jgi:hypothetical protein